MNTQKQIVHTLTKRCFQRNKSRNLIAILAIFLTTMMFTALFTMAQSLGDNMTQMYLYQSGTAAHSNTKQITEEQIEQIAAHPDVAGSGWSIVVGLADNQCLAGRQLEIRFASDSYAEYAFAYPAVGKMPETVDEIALDTLTISRLGLPLELGQPVTLEWGLSDSRPASSTFTLCGWWEGNLSSYASMAWVSEAFARDACGNVSVPQEGQICGQRMMSLTFSDSEDIDRKTEAVLRDCGLTELEFHTNIAYSAEIQQSIQMENLPLYGGMVLVFLAGYLIIYNVFQISVAADIQFYGKLKTLGMTKRQLKKLIYGQSNRLSCIGIPAGLLAGYLFGSVLVPALVLSQGTAPEISADPVIFAGSALFSYSTVLASCMLPARLAARVSPVEALRYTDADTNIPKKNRRTEHGASLARMAWANLWRNRKRTITVICSFTLGLVLMSFFYAKNASFDMDKYLLDLTAADFEIDDATNRLVSGYDPSSQTISDALLAEIAATGALEATGRLYSQQIDLTLSKQTRRNLSEFYTQERLELFASYDPTFPMWKEQFDQAVSGQVNSYTIYGADGLILEAAASKNYIFDGVYDAERFASGEYALAIGPSAEADSGVPTYSVGEKLRIAGRELEIMAVVTPLQPMVQGTSPTFDLPLIISAGTFQEIWPDCHLRKFYFNVRDEAMEEVEALLVRCQQAEAPGMNIVSRRMMAEQYEAETRSATVMGYAISIVVALVGVLNFVNSMMTAIISRKREFAVIQSIGMTKRQLCRMLLFEGLYYAGITLAASYVFGAVAVGVVVRRAVAGGFSTFRFTLLPLVLCTPVLLALAALIPFLCFKNLERMSITERLKGTE